MAVTTGWVEAQFVQRGLGDHIVTDEETKQQRLERIAMQLNTGRSEQEFLSTLDAQAAELAETGDISFDPSGALQFGGEGAAELQARSGANGQVWRETDTGMTYLVYFTPFSGVPLLYSMDSSQLKAMFSDLEVTYDRDLTSNEIAQLGGLRAGDLADVRANPYEELLDQIEREQEVRPWLRDPEVLAIVTEAAIEGRAVSEAELQQTEWWRTRTESQRQWALLTESDPATAAQELRAAAIQTQTALRQLGVNNASIELVNALAAKVTSGEWSATKYNNQLRALSDPYSGVPIDGSISALVQGNELDTTASREADVRSLAARWLGPAYGQMSEDQIQQWAGQFRNDPDAEGKFIEMLQAQRLALFPEYTDPNRTYEDIAGPWRNLVTQVWGQQPDETDGFFQNIVRMNDLTQAQQALRSEGFKRGVAKVGNDLISALGATSIGQQVRSL